MNRDAIRNIIFLILWIIILINGLTDCNITKMQYFLSNLMVITFYIKEIIK